MFDTTEGQFLLSTTRIQTKKNNTHGVATGFFFSYRYEQKDFRFLVTNSHVVKNKDEIKLNLLKRDNGNPILGSNVTLTLTDYEKLWFHHEQYDLAVSPSLTLLKEMIEKGVKLTVRTIPSTFIPDFSQAPLSTSIEDVYFIGYSDGLWDSINNLPIIRKGSVASLMGIPYGGQERFIIDATTIPGSSGSPVFVHNKSLYSGQNSLVIGGRLLFVGILDKTLRVRPNIGTEEVPIPLSKEDDSPYARINIGGVIKSTVLKDFTRKILIDHEEIPG